MKYLSIIVLAFFINFTALPGLAAFFDWDLPTLNTNITEEEVKSFIRQLATTKLELRAKSAKKSCR